MKSKQHTFDAVTRGHWTRTVAELPQLYALTYNGCLVTVLDTTQLPYSPRYRKHTWAQLGTARTQAGRYNKQFGTDAFGVAELSIAKLIDQ